jgi:hypothetical protein
MVVAQLSAGAAERWRDGLAGIQQVRLVCVVVRLRTDCKEIEYQGRLRIERWEVPICEVVV